MKITQTHLKVVVLGLIPVFFIVSAILPKDFTSYLLLGLVMAVALGISYIGMRMEKKEAQDSGEDLLALPPKK